MEESLKDYDFIRLNVCDIFGQHRGKTAPTSQAAALCHDGMWVFGGLQLIGTRTEMYMPDDFETSNGVARPILDTLKPLPWAGKTINRTTSGQEWRVGNLICEVYLPGKNEHSPLDIRFMARRQLEKLKDEFNCTLLSAAEHEFVLLDPVTKEPTFSGVDCLNHQLQSEYEGLFFSIIDNLSKCGVEVESFSTEYGRGQFELAMKPMSGVEAADCSFMLKEATKEICAKHGYMASFMTKVYEEDQCTSSTHFNHSLWDLDGGNAFYAANEDKGMSALFRHWTAGVLHHLDALTAVCCPTVNCYRRIGQPFAPSLLNWGYDNRLSTLRAKAYSPGGSYLENRLPSSASNPYLVMASVVAAGMDGMRRKLELPNEMEADAKALPSSLDEALTALENDSVMVDALGGKFIKSLAACKRESEIKPLAGVSKAIANLTLFEKERHLYLEYM